MNRRDLWWLVAGAFLLVTSACQVVALETPREATRAAMADAQPTASSTVELMAAPTSTGTSPGPTTTPLPQDRNETLTLWVNETSEAHRQVLTGMADAFTAETGVHVEVVMINPELLPQLMNTAVLSGTVPDLVLHPMEYSVGWVERGILDPEAVAEVVDRLDPETFNSQALALVQVEEGLAAIPSDGYQQLIIYRTDWFDDAGLQPPVDYDAMLTAASTLYHTPTLTAGFVVPTESDLLSTQFVFEQMALANGCQLIDEKGEVQILHPDCLEALDFYRQIINLYSPSDVQTAISTLNAYLSGRAGLIIAPPSVLPQLAGLDPDFPLRCPECDDPGFLVENSAILTRLNGGQGPAAAPANFSEMTLLGITTRADRETAQALALHWFGDNYLDWLGIEPARKVPLREGDESDPDRYIDAWGDLPLGVDQPSLRELAGDEVVATLSDGLADSPRWAFRQGQGALVSRMAEKLTFSILLQEMLSGYFTSSQTIIEAYQRITDLIPDYPYYPTLEPEGTPVPTPGA